jgi:hypothetical protein
MYLQYQINYKMKSKKIQRLMYQDLQYTIIAFI